MAPTPYAELHCHTNFSFLDGASAPDDLVERAVDLGLTGLAVTDHNGLYGAVRFVSAAEAVGLHPVLGLEIELLDPAVAGPDRDRRPAPRGRDGRGGVPSRPRRPRDRRGRDRGPARAGPARPAPACPAIANRSRRTCAASASGTAARICAPRPLAGRLAEPVPARLAGQLAGTKGVPRFNQALLAEHTEGLVALSGCRDGELARRLRTGDRAGARAVAERYATLFGRGDGTATSGFFVELSHHLLPDDDWLVAEAAALADEAGLPVVVTNDVHYARPEDRELADVLSAIKHGRSLDTLGDLRRPDGESSLKSGADMAALGASLGGRGGSGLGGGDVDGGRARGVVLGRSRLRAVPLPGLPGARRRDPVLVSVGAVLGRRPEALPPGDLGGRQAARPRARGHRAGRPRRVLPHLLGPDALREGAGIRPRAGAARPARSCRTRSASAGSSRSPTTSCSSGSSTRAGRPTRTSTSTSRSERREEVIQYVYKRYGPEHTGMVCNLVTYRARSAVREVGYALGFPRPLVDRVAKALETYDSVMVRRDLEADGGFAEFFRRPGEGLPAEAARGRGRRGARLRRRDGPAQHAGAARRQGAALAPATEAGGPECAATVRLAPRGRGGAGGRPEPAGEPDPRHLAATFVLGEAETPGRPDPGGPHAQTGGQGGANDRLGSHTTNEAAIWQERAQSTFRDRLDDPTLPPPANPGLAGGYGSSAAPNSRSGGAPNGPSAWQVRKMLVGAAFGEGRDPHTPGCGRAPRSRRPPIRARWSPRRRGRSGRHPGQRRVAA